MPIPVSKSPIFARFSHWLKVLLGTPNSKDAFVVPISLVSFTAYDLYYFVYCLVILFTFSDMTDLRFFLFLDYLFEVFVSSIIIQHHL